MKADITFKYCVQDVHDIGTPESADDRMVSHLVFDLKIGTKIYPDMKLEIRQPHGFDYSKPSSFPIEVSLPKEGFAGPWNHESLSHAAEDYYRAIIGATGRAVAFAPGAKLRMRNNIIDMKKAYVIDLPDKGGAW